MTERDQQRKYVPEVKKKLLSKALTDDNNILLGHIFLTVGQISHTYCFVMSSAELKAKFYHLTDLTINTQHSYFCLHLSMTNFCTE